MKKILSVLSIVTVFIISCTKDAKTPGTNSNSSNSTVITGDFIITKFTDSNPSEDKTSDFNNYAFRFNNDGSVYAVKNGVTVQGSYSEKPSHEGEGAKLTISFSDAPFNELNKSWQIDLISGSAIHLSDDDNAGEVLEFTAQ